MMDGVHLSGDHSFKLTKVVLAGGSKPFTAMYCILNEYGQVVGWWFTTGTGMGELEESIKMIKVRYLKYGYDGPESVTTDRCCQERLFWKRALSLVEEHLSGQPISDEELNEIDVLDPPHPVTPACVASDLETANLFVGWISKYIMEGPQDLMALPLMASGALDIPKSIC